MDLEPTHRGRVASEEEVKKRPVHTDLDKKVRNGWLVVILNDDVMLNLYNNALFEYWMFMVVWV